MNKRKAKRAALKRQKSKDRDFYKYAHSMQYKTMSGFLTDKQVIKAGENMSVTNGEMIEAIVEESKDKIHIDCKKGCSFCCYQPVDCSLPEVFFLFDYLLDNNTEQELTEIRNKAQDHRHKTMHLNLDQRNALPYPCELLKDNACSAYAARPLPCRYYFSNSAKQCETMLGNDRMSHEIQVHEIAMKLGVELQKAAIKAIRDQKLQISVRLENALSLLPKNRAELRTMISDFLDGKKVF